MRRTMTPKAGQRRSVSSGNWKRNGNGAFTYDTSTVTFTNVSGNVGTSTIAGATTFYNLSCVTASKTLQFKAVRSSLLQICLPSTVRPQAQG